jgi:hypothetical protein
MPVVIFLVLALLPLMPAPAPGSATQEQNNGSRYQEAKQTVTPVIAMGASKPGKVNIANPCRQQSADMSKIVGIAVYPYRREHDNLQCEGKRLLTIIGNKQHIQLITESFDRAPLPGGSLGTFPNAYVYFKDTDGGITQGIVVMAWQYILLDRDISKLYRLDKPSIEILRGRVERSSPQP